MYNKTNQNIEAHYNRTNLFEKIKEALLNSGVDLNNLTRKDISGVDEFHVRGIQVSEELAEAAKLNNAKVLDVGCGLGGPARLLADKFNCSVTGIDLSKEYVNAAKGLSELTGFAHKTKFIYGNALALPFESESYDAVWIQHVQMNVEDKFKFYSEIYRALKNKGTFIFYDIFTNGKTNINYPMPWAADPEISFLKAFKEVESILEEIGLKKLLTADQTEKGISSMEKLLSKIENGQTPKIGLNLLMGETTNIKLANLFSALKLYGLILVSGVYLKR